MYDDILLPVDGSPGTAPILAHTRDIAQAFDATVHVLYVADTARDSVTTIGGKVLDALVEAGESIVAEAGRTVGGVGVDYDTDVVQGDPAATIADYAARYDMDLIVVPTHARTGVDRALLGSVTEKVVRLAPVPVLTARLHPEERLVFPYEALLVAVDGSPPAERAAAHAIELGAALDARLHFLWVVEGSPVEITGIEDPDRDAAATDMLADLVADATARGLDAVEHLEHGDPPEMIGATIEDSGIDAVLMGRTGRRGVERILLGSVAERTIRTAPVPVITVPGDR